MESAYQGRNELGGTCYSDSNRFLTFSKIHLRDRYEEQLADESLRASMIDPRLAKDKMKSNIYKVLTNYSERSSPALVKSLMWREMPNEVTKEYQKIPERTYDYAQVSKTLTKVQSDVFEILKQSKKLDEMSIKTKLWEIFNILSHEIWIKCFKSKHQDNELLQENRQLRNNLDHMEEQMIKLKTQLHEMEIGGIDSEIHLLKAEIRRMKEIGQNLQFELNQKAALVQNQEKELIFFRNEMRNREKDIRGKSAGRKGGHSDDLRGKIFEVTQERNSLIEWKNCFTQYFSNYENSIKKIKDDHQYEKQILQESIDHLQNFIRDKDIKPQAKTTPGFFLQNEREIASRSPDIKSNNNENKFKETIVALKKEKNQLKESLDMIVKDYENVCLNFKAQSGEFERAKKDFEATILRYEKKIKNNIEKKDKEDFDGMVKFEESRRGKKKDIRGRKVEKNNQDMEVDGLKERIQYLESDKKKLEEVINLENIQANLLSEKIIQLTSQLQAQSLQIISLESEKSKLLTKAKELEIVQKTVKSLEFQNSSLQTSVFSLQKDLETMKDLHEKSQSNQINSIKLQTNTSNQELLNQKLKIQHLENEKNSSIQELANLKTNLDIKIQEIHTLENKIILLQDKENEYKENFGKYLDDARENIQKDRNQYKILVMEKDKEKEVLENTIKSLYDLISEREQKIALQERILDDLAKKMNEKNRENEGLMQKIGKLEEQIKKDIFDLEKSKEKEKKLMKFRNQVKKVNEDLAEQMMMTNNLEKQISGLQAALKDAEKITEDKITENIILNDAFLGVKEELQELKLKKQENLHYSEVFIDEIVKISKTESEFARKHEKCEKKVEEISTLSIKDQDDTKVAKIINSDTQTKLEKISFEKAQSIKDIADLNEKVNYLNASLLEKSQETAKVLQNFEILTKKIEFYEEQISSSQEKDEQKKFEMEKLQQKIKFITFENEDLKRKLIEKEVDYAKNFKGYEELRENSQMLEGFEDQIEDLVRRLAEKDKEVDFFKEEHEKLAKELEEKVKENEEIRADMENLMEKDRENEDLVKLVDELREENKEKKENLDRNAIQIRKKDLDLSEKCREMHELNNKINDFKAEILNIKEEVKRLEIENEEGKKEINNFMMKIARLEKVISENKGRIMILEMENIKLNDAAKEYGKILVLEIENEKLNDTLKRKDKEHKKLNTALEEKDKEYEKLKEENYMSISKLNEEKGNYIKSINETNLKLQNIEKANSELKESLDDKEKQLKDYQTIFSQYKENLNSLELNLQESEHQVEYFKEISEKYKNHANSIEQTLLSTQEHFKATIQNKEIAIQTLETHIETLTLTLSSLESTTKPLYSLNCPKLSTGEEIQSLSQESFEELIKKHELELQNKQNQIFELEFSYIECKEREKYAFELLTKHEKENMNLQNKIDTLFQEKNQLNSYIKKLKEDAIAEKNNNNMMKTLEAKENEYFLYRILTLRDNIMKQDNNIRKLEEDIKKSYGKIEEQTQDIADLEEKIKGLNNEIKYKKREIQEIVKEKIRIEKEVCKKDEKIYENTLEIKKSEEIIEFLQEEVNNKENEILALKESIENLNTSLEISMNSYDESIKSLKEDAEKADATIREKEKEVKDMKIVVKSKDAELKRLAEEGRNAENAFQNKIVLLMKDIAAKDEEINKARMHNKILSEAVRKNSENEILIFNSQKEPKKNLNDRIKKSNAINNTRKQEEIDEIKKSLEQEKQSRTNFELKLLSSEKEKNVILAEASQEKELLKSEIEDLTEKLEKLQISNQQANLNIEKLKSKLSDDDLVLKENTDLIIKQAELIKDLEIIEQQKIEFEELFEKEKLIKSKLNDKIARLSIKNRKFKDFEVKRISLQNVNDNYKSTIQSLEGKLIENNRNFELEKRNLCLNKNQEIKNLRANIEELEEELQKKEKIMKELQNITLKDINPSIEIPYHEQLEEKINTLNELLEEFLSMKKLDLPEEFKSNTIVNTIEIMIKHYSESKFINNIEINKANPEIVTIVSPNDTYSEHSHSEHSYKLTVEEVNDLIKRENDLEKENLDLKKKNSLLNEPLTHFENARSSDRFAGKSDTPIENIREIFTLILEKIPLQGGDTEKNIKKLLDILNISKEYKNKITEARGIKKKKKGFMGLFR
ncbi:hypothetical protein SteCoe_11399 [Stentor coeruleus]|uniref:Uncharacterized protein n=1 Tax=Stentor coeruleus TaxID=5963 RepID=A0A1R2CDF2_9CILI|nr:hypothetical protein SteCoe_11399 [Stentor coeruleus]